MAAYDDTIGMKPEQPAWRSRDMRKLCILNPDQKGLDFNQLREKCRCSKWGQMIDFEWNKENCTYAFVLFNTDE